LAKDWQFTWRRKVVSCHALRRQMSVKEPEALMSLGSNVDVVVVGADDRGRCVRGRSAGTLVAALPPACGPQRCSETAARNSWSSGSARASGSRDLQRQSITAIIHTAHLLADEEQGPGHALARCGNTRCIGSLCQEGRIGRGEAARNIRPALGGGRGTRTHKSFRTTVFKLYALRPGSSCLGLTRPVGSGHRRSCFLSHPVSS